MQKFPQNLLDDIQKHFLEEKAHLETRIRELTLQDPFSDPERLNDNAASDLEATEESSHDRVSALIDELRQRANDIDQALLRVSNGTYGYCTECSALIDTDRLGILPTATLCAVCERKKKH
ncbi:MAG: hypothetical protein Q7S76_01480 [bacterium]|nr:hypothetical protein [bacterium]